MKTMSYVSLVEFIDEMLSNNDEVTEGSMEIYFDYLEGISKSGGFLPDQLDETWRKILKLKQTAKQFVTSVFYLIPSSKVLKTTLNHLVGWIFQNYCNKDYRKQNKAIVQWLIGVVKIGFVPAVDLQHCYYIFLKILGNTLLKDDISHLIYICTDYKMVTEYAVKIVTAISLKESGINGMSALLSLYKRLKPHLLPDDNIRIRQNEDLFGHINKKFLYHLQANRKESKNDSTENETNCFSDWSANTISFKRKHSTSVRSYGELGAEKSLQECVNSEIYFQGTVFNSMLLNQYSLALLKLSNERFHKMIHLYWKREFLTKDLIEQPHNKSKKNILKCLHKLQRFNNEEIYNVGSFLRHILPNWNGQKYQTEIFSLLENITITEYTKFFDDILYPLYLLNLRRELNFFSLTIKTISVMLYNNFMYLYNGTDGIIKWKQRQPCEKSIELTQKCFEHFCLLFLNIHPGRALLMHTIVDGYLLLSSLPSNIRAKTVMPNEIVHRILVNSDVVLFEKLALVLNRNVLRLSESDLSNLPVELKVQITEVIETLLGSIFNCSLFSEEFQCPLIDRKIKSFPLVLNYFRFINSLTFMSIIRINEDNFFQQEFNPKIGYEKRKNHCPNLHKLIEDFQHLLITDEGHRISM